LKQAAQDSGVQCIKLASNENPFGPSPRAIEAMREAAAGVHLYPYINAVELCEKIAARAQVEANQVLITSGSSQFLNVLCYSLLAPGLNAVTSERSFIAYATAAQAAGGTLKKVPMNGDTFNIEGMLAAIDANTRIVLITNPNNPTGTIVDAPTVTRFLDRVPEHVLVVLDEAYSEFAEHFATLRGVEYTRSLDYVREGRNVLVLRTFSKAQGLAGLRVAYGFGPAELMSYFRNALTPFSVSSLAQVAALAALDDEEHTRKTVENNASGAALLTQAISEMGLRVVPTWANFLYIEVGEDAAAVAKRMEQEGVIVRPLTGGWGAPTAIRITVGSPEENQKCIEVMKHVLARAAV
jgi:histidinol-phosphate aminotransferase